MGKAQKVERARRLPWLFRRLVRFRRSPKRYQARLVWMQVQSVLLEPVEQLPDAPCPPIPGCRNLTLDFRLET